MHLGYRLALYLTLVLAAVNVAFLLYAAHMRSIPTHSIAIYASGALILAFGLWVQSKIARYLGAIFCFGCAAAVAWPIFVGDRIVMSLGLLWIISMGVLSLVIGCLLIFSKTFSKEFSFERTNQPRYKAHLRNGVIALLAIAAAVATVNDILHLASL